MEEKLNEWITQASRYQSDDIHIHPEETEYVISIRRMNKLEKIDSLSFEVGYQTIRYIKYIANMEVGEKRRPQDGAIVFTREDSSKIELRISTIANYLLQESLVIRLLHQERSDISQTHPLNEEALTCLYQYIRRKTGLLIFSGPVSSGKTTTIYHLLRNSYQEKQKQIITIEDPIEIKEAKFLQTEINQKANVDYDTLISASLRHHPDILVIGEVRTEHMARMMIRAALTGHLVVATIHAKDTQGVIGRLRELGITKEQLIQTLLAVTTQRLVPSQLDEGHPILLFELLHGQMLHDLIIEGVVNQQFKSLNQILLEALKRNEISESSYEHYKIEENINYRSE